MFESTRMLSQRRASNSQLLETERDFKFKALLWIIVVFGAFAKIGDSQKIDAVLVL